MRLGVHITQISGTQMAAKIDGTFEIFDDGDDDHAHDGSRLGGNSSSGFGDVPQAAGTGGCGCASKDGNGGDLDACAHVHDDDNDHKLGLSHKKTDSACTSALSFPFEAIAFGRIGGQNIGAKLSDSVMADLANAGYDADDVILILQNSLLQGNLTLPEGLSREMFADDP